MTDRITEAVARVREQLLHGHDDDWAAWDENGACPMVRVADLRALLAAYDTLTAERDALRERLVRAEADTARLEAIVTRRLQVSACDGCELDGEYRINVAAPSGAGHCNNATLDGLRSGIDATAGMHPNHFALDAARRAPDTEGQ